MPKPEVQRVPCLHCTRGPNGGQDCASGAGARTVSMGCFLGAYLPKRAPKRYLGTPVTTVEAPTYADAWRIAQEANYPQWIWVKDGIPGESR